MGKLIIIRHGRTDWCKEERVRGSMDIPLNEEGTEEARKISEELSKTKIDAVYSSKTSCSLSTANEIAMAHKLKVKELNELKELDLGLWQGLLLTEVKKRYHKQYNAWKASPASGPPPGGESASDAYERIIRAMHKLVERHKEDNICVVSGSITLSIIKSYLKNIAFEEMWKSIPDKTWWEVFDI